MEQGIIFVKSLQAKGKSKEEISQQLTTAGWSAEQIESLFKQLEKPEIQPTVPVVPTEPKAQEVVEEEPETTGGHLWIWVVVIFLVLLLAAAVYYFLF